MCQYTLQTPMWAQGAGDAAGLRLTGFNMLVSVAWHCRVVFSRLLSGHVVAS